MLIAARNALQDEVIMSANEQVFFTQSAGIHCLELEAESMQKLTPSIWKGDGDADSYQSRTRRVPAMRIYSFCDAPIALGQIGIVNANRFCELDYPSFAESSRFNELRNRELISDWQPDRVALKVPAQSITINGDCALITQHGDHVWGHWLVDVLPRLEIVRRLKPDITFAFSSLLRCSGELIEKTGLRPDQMVFYDPYRTVLRADRFFVPGSVRFANAFATATGPIFKSMSAHQRIRARKIYISRARLREGSSILNQEAIEAVFIRRGFQVVHPETMSIGQQIAMFSCASYLAGEYGSGLHGSIFSAPGTPVLCLQSPSMKQYVQAGLGKVMNHPTGFVFGTPGSDPSPLLKKVPSYDSRYSVIDTTIANDAIDELLSL